jgi:hypothetical protein
MDLVRGSGSSDDILSIWRDEAHDVGGRALDCGHFLEERPEDIAAELLDLCSPEA